MSRFVSSLRSSLNERGLSDRRLGDRLNGGGLRNRLHGRGLSDRLNGRELSDRGLRDRLDERGNPSSLQEGGTPSRSLSERSETKRASRQRGTN